MFNKKVFFVILSSFGYCYGSDVSPESIQHSADFSPSKSSVSSSSVSRTLTSSRIYAKDFVEQKGTQLGGDVIGYFDQGDYITYGPLDFGPVGATFGIRIRYAKENSDGKLEVRLGSSTGKVVGEFSPPGTGGWGNYIETTFPINPEGTDFLVFVGVQGFGVLNLHWFELMQRDLNPDLNCIIQDMKVTGACTVENVQAELDYVNCTAKPSAEEIEDACKKAEIPFGEITNQFYQHDKAFMEGGSIWNNAAQSIEDVVEVGLDRIHRVKSEVVGNSMISWPTYEALEPFYYNNFANKTQKPYMSEFNKTESCFLNTIMCCFTNKDDGTELSPTEATSEVCAHDLHDSRHSSHVNRGWVEYDHNATCTGFTFDDADATSRYAGNSIFDISFSNRLNGYIKNIPGAPMCACIEKMPSVSKADCRKTIVKDETFTFSYNKFSMLTVSDINAVVSFEDCDTDLKDYAKTTYGRDLSSKLTGDCAQSREDLRNEKFWIKGSPKVDRYPIIDHSKFVPIVGKELLYWPLRYDISRNDRSKYGLPRMEDEVILRENIGAANCSQFIIRRICNFCYESHIDIYYKRFTCLPAADEMKLLDLLMNNWKNTNNVRGIDFNLYSTLEDAISGFATSEDAGVDPNAWTYCNFNENNVGFPRDCGPNGYVPRNWNSFRRGTYHEARSMAFYYYVQ